MVYGDSWTGNANGITMNKASIVINPERLRPHHALLRQLAPVSVRYLFENFGSIIRAKPEQYIYVENEPSTSAFIILVGRLILSTKKVGVFSTIYTGQTVGEDAILEGNQKRKETVQAVEETFLLEVPREEWKKNLREVKDGKVKVDLFTVKNVMKKNWVVKRGGSLNKEHGYI